MKNHLSNIAPEGTHIREVMGGLLLWTGENLQALLFFMETERRIRCKRNFLKMKKKGT